MCTHVVRACVRSCTCVYLRTSACVRACVCIFMHLCICVCVCSCVSVCICTHVCAHGYVHTRVPACILVCVFVCVSLTVCLSVCDLQSEKFVEISQPSGTVRSGVTVLHLTVVIPGLTELAVLLVIWLIAIITAVPRLLGAGRRDMSYECLRTSINVISL